MGLMRILGIDPGSNLIGYGVIEKNGNSLSAVDFGCLSLPKALQNGENLLKIEEWALSLLDKHRPEIFAIEKLFFFKNLKTALPVSEARGVIMLAAAKKRIEIKEYTPLQIKQAVSAYGRADKTQIQKMVKLTLNLKEIPKPDDAADALACAVCCARSIKHSKVE